MMNRLVTTKWFYLEYKHCTAYTYMVMNLHKISLSFDKYQGIPSMGSTFSTTLKSYR